MVKAPATPGTYLLRTIDPNSSLIRASVSPYRDSNFPNGIDPAWRMSRRSFDFPIPCPGGQVSPLTCSNPPPTLNYPITLATVVVAGSPVSMNLPADPLPVPTGLPSIATMQNRVPDKVRQIVFELCGGVTGSQTVDMGKGGTVGPFKPFSNPAACGWYFAKYDATYWGGTPFTTLLMMRDADDVGQPSGNPNMPLVNFTKDGLFNASQPLFPDMIAGNYEEWTIYNRSFSDHPWHLHQNHVLITKINGVSLPLPEWHDTLLVPAAFCPDGTSPPPGTPTGGGGGQAQRRGGPGAGRLAAGAGPSGPTGTTDPTVTCWGSGQATTPGPGGFSGKITDATPGTITFRVYYNPITAGCFVAHCHIIDHEDLGMMQRFDILPAPGQPSGCAVDVAATPDLRKRLALGSSFEFCTSPFAQRSAPRFTPVTDIQATAASISSDFDKTPRWNLLDNVLRPIFPGL
jgi:hypothetical protein